MEDYKGVHWNRRWNKWKSTVTSKGVKYDCGMFLTQKEAVLSRDKKILGLGLDVKLQILKPLKK